MSRNRETTDRVPVEKVTRPCSRDRDQRDPRLPSPAAFLVRLFCLDNHSLVDISRAMRVRSVERERLCVCVCVSVSVCARARVCYSLSLFLPFSLAFSPPLFLSPSSCVCLCVCACECVKRSCGAPRAWPTEKARVSVPSAGGPRTGSVRRSIDTRKGTLDRYSFGRKLARVT